MESLILKDEVLYSYKGYTPLTHFSSDIQEHETMYICNILQPVCRQPDIIQLNELPITIMD